MTDRVPCDVSGCKHTMGRKVYVRRFKHEPGGWICSTHWAMVPRRLKRLKSRHEREKRRFDFYPREEALDRLWRAIWRTFDGGK